MNQRVMSVLPFFCPDHPKYFGIKLKLSVIRQVEILHTGNTQPSCTIIVEISHTGNTQPSCTIVVEIPHTGNTQPSCTIVGNLSKWFLPYTF